MRTYQIALLGATLAGVFAASAYAHQPVMDMAPRWEEGWGLQLRHESFGSKTLKQGTSKIANPLGLERHVRMTWVEGVYTFDRAKRVTFKLPYVRQRRVKNLSGVGRLQKNSGLGDLIVGVPLKHYRNKGAYTDNFGITPSLRVPTGGSSGAFPISDGSWDVGISLSHSAETPLFYSLVDLFYWKNNQGRQDMREGDTIGLDVNLGVHPIHDNDTNSGLFLMLDVSARHNDDPNAATRTTATGGRRVQMGPVVVLYKDNVMFRAEYRHAVYERTSSISNARGHEFSVGLGATF